MERSQIKKNIGKVVAYTDRDGNILPAKILDARLWETWKGDSTHVQLSNNTRAANHGSSSIGYPVLMPLRGVHHARRDRAQLEKWLADTVITMEDLFDEQGDQRNPARWAEFSRCFFRVVFPASIREDLPGLREAKKARDLAKDAEWDARRRASEARMRRGVEVSNSLAKLGFKSPDRHPIVTTHSLSDDRMSVPTDVLEELLRIAMPYMRGCAKCGTHDFLLPYGHPTLGQQMLCSECHPNVFM